MNQIETFETFIHDFKAGERVAINRKYWLNSAKEELSDSNNSQASFIEFCKNAYSTQKFYRNSPNKDNYEQVVDK